MGSTIGIFGKIQCHTGPCGKEQRIEILQLRGRAVNSRVLNE
ncbi:MAG: hypothetical protein FD165_645 [Gammaproteobacteria bacterium]|nr:MAG: hypothetical protein FD165_645 [Gammaproteobacteria bacterium]TND02091.1 MAG: hypothetical protein FD120_2255 [Gammaproteobacteria bacterium]